MEGAIQGAATAELILLGDTARGAGELAVARRVYELARRRAPGTHSAAFAAFALGRLEFDDRGAFREAAEWFGKYLREEPRGDLAREARGRLMESLHRAGSESAARQTAGEYLRLHPQGPHARLAARLARVQEPHR
jgi:TolA-binding protein